MTPTNSRPTSYEEACAMNGTEPMNEAALRQLGITPGQIAGLKLEEIAKALNQGKLIHNVDDVVWYPAFCIDSNGMYFFNHSIQTFVFSNLYRYSTFRFALHERADSDYSGTHFLELWKEYLLNKK